MRDATSMNKKSATQAEPGHFDICRWVCIGEALLFAVSTWGAVATRGAERALPHEPHC